MLNAAVRDNLATLLAEASELERGLPRYVERDFADSSQVFPRRAKKVAAA